MKQVEKLMNNFIYLKSILLDTVVAILIDSGNWPQSSTDAVVEMGPLHPAAAPINKPCMFFIMLKCDFLLSKGKMA